MKNRDPSTGKQSLTCSGLRKRFLMWTHNCMQEHEVGRYSTPPGKSWAVPCGFAIYFQLGISQCPEEGNKAGKSLVLSGRSWGHLGCLVWRKGGPEATSLLSSTSQGGEAEREVPVSALWEPVTEHRGMAQSWALGGSDWALGTIYFLWGWLNTGAGSLVIWWLVSRACSRGIWTP